MQSCIEVSLGPVLKKFVGAETLFIAISLDM